MTHKMSTCHCTKLQWRRSSKLCWETNPVIYELNLHGNDSDPPSYSVLDCSSKRQRWRSLTEEYQTRWHPLGSELIYRANPVTAGDGDDNRAGSHEAGNRKRTGSQYNSSSDWASGRCFHTIWCISISLSGSPPPTLSLIRWVCRHDVWVSGGVWKQLRDGTVIWAWCWVSG